MKVNHKNDIIVVNQDLPKQILILPLNTRPLFPNMIIPISFDGEYPVNILQKIYNSSNKLLGLVLAKELNQEDILKSKFYKVGVVVKILQLHNHGYDSAQALISVERIFDFNKVVKKRPLTWDVSYRKSAKFDKNEIKPYLRSIIQKVRMLLTDNGLIKEQIKSTLSQIHNDEPETLMNLVSYILSSEHNKLQNLLEEKDLIEKAKKLIILLNEDIQIMKVKENVEKQLEKKVSDRQKEYILREQLSIIKKELGMEQDETEQQIKKINEKISKLVLTKEAKEVVKEEIQKIKTLNQSSPEYNVSLSYLKEISDLPWGITTTTKNNIKKANKILNEDHYGLEDIKNRILEFIAVLINKPSANSAVICLVGPPGVGKTSVGKSIARAMGLEFYRLSVGGMTDEAEIKGHRRTYIGAMPGKIIQALKRVKTSNPLIMLDEIDKIGTSYRGDPTATLLEALDPEQNKEFLDHYLDLRFDLSKVLFITTANQLDTIPAPLLDRMEIINLAGYIANEKVQIAKRYLIPKQMEAHGIKININISSKNLEYIIENYAREPGVRSLEKVIKKIIRKANLKLLKNPKEAVKTLKIDQKAIKDYLGEAIFTTELLYKKSIPGVSLGLAWTSMGGVTLYIEAIRMKSKQASFQQTGQLGDVMKESTQIAYSYIKKILDQKNNDFFDNSLIHIHVPSGATPKDGPSAGITIALALYSLAINKPIKNGLAMTGELTLTGKVLPIGGVKEKTMAAKRVNVYELIFPKENKVEFSKLPDNIKEGIKAHFIEEFEQVLKIAF